MKKICILAGLIITSQLSLGQRFFYIEGNSATGKLLSEGLKQAFQYVTSTPLASDYIIKSEMAMQSGSHTFMINLILQDSVTFKTIYQANEAIYHRSPESKSKNIFQYGRSHLH